MRKFKPNKWLALILLCLIANLAFATHQSFLQKLFQTNAWFIGAGTGVAWPDLDKSSTTVSNGSGQPSPYDVDLYTIRSISSEYIWSLLAGYRWQRSSAFLPDYSLALRYQHLDSFKIKGAIEQYSLPSFTNYNYSMKASSDIVTLLAKLDIYRFHAFSPYVTLGLGEAFNKVRNYKEQAYSGIIPRVSPDYKDHTSTNFTYDVGVGIDYFINPSFTVSLGYEYADLGNVDSGKGAASTWTGESLSFGKLTSNTILLNIYYQLPLN